VLYTIVRTLTFYFYDDVHGIQNSEGIEELLTVGPPTLSTTFTSLVKAHPR
jgi:hypothetical protein